MRKYFLLALGVVLFLNTAMPLSAAILLEKDMVAFDKVYIPALVLTRQGNKAAAKKAMKLTAAEWKVFKKKHAADFKKNKADMVDLTIISQKIADAERTVRANGNLDYAHDILEGVRNSFLKMRQRNSINYYIDYTTKFSEPMETIVLIARGKTPETLTDTMLLKIKDNFKAAKQDWENLQNASFDPALFSFDAKKDAQRQGYIKAETEAMNKLNKALEGGDKEEIIKAAMGIKSNFFSLFLLFGDFEKVK
jgi:DNA-binding protein